MIRDHDMQPVGFANGLVVSASRALLAQKGEAAVRCALGLERRFPVTTDLSGNTVMVVADSHEEAVRKYLRREAAVTEKGATL